MRPESAHRGSSRGRTLPRPDVDDREQRDDQEEQRRLRRAVADLLEVDELLAAIDRHRRRVRRVRGQHVDEVEDPQRVEQRKITATISAGLISGSVTLKNTLTGWMPSTRAAS